MVFIGCCFTFFGMVVYFGFRDLVIVFLGGGIFGW